MNTPGGALCGPRMREASRHPVGVKWCFCCRRRRRFHQVVAVPEGVSYYGPSVWIECGTCRGVDADLFPGSAREWTGE